MSLRENLTDATLASIGSKTTQAGAATAIAGWLTLSNFASIVGILGVIAGIAINWYYRRKADRREAELHRLEVDRLSRTP